VQDPKEEQEPKEKKDSEPQQHSPPGNGAKSEFGKSSKPPNEANERKSKREKRHAHRDPKARTAKRHHDKNNGEASRRELRQPPKQIADSEEDASADENTGYVTREGDQPVIRRVYLRRGTARNPRFGLDQKPVGPERRPVVSIFDDGHEPN
jgi:hypothetical protein